MLPKIKKARQLKAVIAAQTQNEVAGTELPSFSPTAHGRTLSINESYGGTVPSKRYATHEVPERTGEGGVSGNDLCAGNFGTFIVHSELEASEEANETPVSDSNESLRAHGYVKHSILSDTIDRKTAVWVENASGTVVTKKPDIHGPEQNTTADSTTQLQVEAIDSKSGDKGDNRSTLKSLSLSHKAFPVQDKLRSIYAAGNTVPIPFLKAIDISPLALVSDNVFGDRGVATTSGGVALEAVKEIFSGDGQTKKGRRGQNEMPLPKGVCERLTSNPTLMNLAQALAYHKACYEDMPLQELQAAQEQKTIQNLCDTLRTILQL